MPPPQSPLHGWFIAEVLPHDTALRAYLRGRFPQLRDVDDVVQETYARILREKSTGRLREVRAFLFTAARNLTLDQFRRQRNFRDQIVPQNVAPDVVDDVPDAALQLTHQEELEILAEALRGLPDRCRHVMLLRYLKGLSYKEIAARLSVSTETVKTQIARGTLRCADHFSARGVQSRFITPTASTSASD